MLWTGSSDALSWIKRCLKQGLFGKCGRSLLYKHQVADDSVGGEDAFAGEAQVIVSHFQLAALQVGGSHRVAIAGELLSEAGFECRQVDTLTGAQGSHDTFVVAGCRA